MYYDAQGQPLVTLPAAGPAIWTRDINLPPIRNARPLSHAGEPAVLYGSTAILDLDGFAIDDGLGPQPLSISWSMEQGPGPVAFDNANAAQTRAHFSQPGTYKLRLRASDGEFATDSFLYATQHTASGAADPSLVLALDFEGNLLDSSGYGNHASAHGDVLRYVRTRATGPQGGSHGVYFNGNSYLTVAHDNSLNITEGTIAFWLQMDHIPALNPGGELLHLLAKSEPGEYTSGNYSLEWNFLGNFVFSFLDQVWDTQGPFLDAWRYARPTPSSPVHVAISFTPNWVKTYLGGRLDHTSKVRAETKFNTAPLYIGSKGPGNGIALTGFIDELRIWNRVLASDEIATHVGISDTNDVPTADAGPNLVVRVNEWTALRGRCLDDTDPGNYPYEYAITRAAEFKEWRKVSGPSYVRIRDRYSKGSAQPASALFDTAGEYQMLLTCFGGSGVDYDAITVTVTP